MRVCDYTGDCMKNCAARSEIQKRQNQVNRKLSTFEACIIIKLYNPFSLSSFSCVPRTTPSLISYGHKTGTSSKSINWRTIKGSSVPATYKRENPSFRPFFKTKIVSSWYRVTLYPLPFLQQPTEKPRFNWLKKKTQIIQNHLTI